MRNVGWLGLKPAAVGTGIPVGCLEKGGMAARISDKRSETLRAFGNEGLV